jgi:hypothetical protein
MMWNTLSVILLCAVSIGLFIWFTKDLDDNE